MKPEFREDKATQAACILIDKEGGTIAYIKLIKLLYLADRKRLLERGRPITFDDYYSLRKGPIGSQTKDLVTDGPILDPDSFWVQHITNPENYEVSIKDKNFPTDSLSEAEVNTLNQVYEEFGHYDRWEIVNWCHDNLDEWKNPGDSSIRIEYRDILMRGGKKTEMETIEIEEELDEIRCVDRMFGV